MIFDTDVFIWLQRGSRRAARLVDEASQRMLSLQTYLELFQGVENRQQQVDTKGFLRDLGFETIPLSPEIGHRAAVYIETYALSHGLRAGNALVAATAVEHGLTLASGNVKHYRPIAGLELRSFRPEK